jgi:hypothetical protein
MELTLAANSKSYIVLYSRFDNRFHSFESYGLFHRYFDSRYVVFKNVIINRGW